MESDNIFLATPTPQQLVTTAIISGWCSAPDRQTDGWCENVALHAIRDEIWRNPSTEGERGIALPTRKCQGTDWFILTSAGTKNTWIEKKKKSCMPKGGQWGQRASSWDNSRCFWQPLWTSLSASEYYSLRLSYLTTSNLFQAMYCMYLREWTELAFNRVQI